MFVKALLSSLVAIHSTGAFTVLAPELVAYQNYIEHVAAEFDASMKELESLYKEKGSSDVLFMKSGVFGRSYAQKLMHIRQMDVYAQSLINKTMNRLIPFMEKVAYDIFMQKKSK